MTRRHLRQPQRGAALLIFLILVVTAALTYVVSNLTPEKIEVLRAKKTNEALMQAREALRWYAETFRDQQNKIQIDGGNAPPNYVYGYLPLPDLGTSSNTNPFGCPGYPSGEGCDANLSGSALNKTVIGRFPWALFGTGPLRDGHGECLWYAVSGSHQRIEKMEPMNWDTLAQIDIVTLSDADPEKLKSLIATAHDRPTAIIFSPGPRLGNQDRGPVGSNVVTLCGGNYSPTNYLEPGLAADLLDSTGNPATSVYYAGAVSTDTATTQQAFSIQGKVYQDGTSLKQSCPTNSPACNLIANDSGKHINGDTLFGDIRKNTYFRTDINALLDRMVSCLRDEIAAGNPPASSYAKIAGADTHACYGKAVDPIGYYPHFKEMVFVARPGNANVTIDGTTQSNCVGALLFAGERNTDQRRSTPTEKSTFSHYLEGDNLISFNSGGSTGTFVGAGRLERVETGGQAREQDIARCIPSGASFAGVESPGLDTNSDGTADFGPLASYNPSTRILTLGQEDAESDEGAPAQALYGCAWQPEAHVTGGGLRAYFKFQIEDTGWVGDGFVFALVDGDGNRTDTYQSNAGLTSGSPAVDLITPGITSKIEIGMPVYGTGIAQGTRVAGITGATSLTLSNPATQTGEYSLKFDWSPCGAAAQHLGYSGNNGYTPPIIPPKIGIEFDTIRHYRSGAGFTDPAGFNPSYLDASPPSNSNLINGRADPDYTGGHIGIVYWGAESPINTGLACGAGCTSPQYCNAGTCFLNPEEDDNVHGRSATLTGDRPPPQNPVAPIAVPTPPAGVYRLDSSQVPKEIDIHVRVELTRSYPRLVRVVAVTTQSPSGLPAIDGISLNSGDRVLLTAQTDGKDNGIWVAAPGAWSRANTEDESGEIPYGTIWRVEEGSQYLNSYWRFNSPAGFDPGIADISISPIPPVTSSLNIRPVKAVTTAHLSSLAGLTSIDGVALQSGDRVLLTAQTEGKYNGVYVVAPGTWLRASTEDDAADMPSGTAWIVRAGSTNAWSYWRLENPAGYILNSTALTITKSSPPWKAVATSSIALAGLPTVAGVQLATDDWILVTGQTSATENGVYKTKTGAWERIPMYQNTYGIQAWMQKYNASQTQRIAKMAMVSRPLSTLDASFPPQLADTAIIYSPQAVACTGNSECPGGQWCGLDNICYRPGLRTLRLGFTNGQGTRDQIINISDFSTTWLP